MQYVRISNQNTVEDILPDVDPKFPEAPPIEKRFHPDFLAMYTPFDDSVQVQLGWVYDPGAGTFSEPPELEPPIQPPDPIADLAAMMVNQEIRLSLLELGVN